ncbi:MAG TPA: hypothetical protein VGN00_07890 [Puia sp.]
MNRTTVYDGKFFVISHYRDDVKDTSFNNRDDSNKSFYRCKSSGKEEKRA